jgi:dethiobiotin synthetase
MSLELEPMSERSQSLAQSLMIVGTDTDVGKTVLTSALVAYWLRYRPHQSLGLLKPLQTGLGDREHYLKCFPELNQTLEELTPQWFSEPLAPPIAAENAGERVALDRLWRGFLQLQQRRQFVLVEGLGGLGSPVTHESTVADLAWDWQLPVVLVVPVRLGAIGQAVANMALARQSRLYVKGIILSCTQPRNAQEIEAWAAPELMSKLTGVPILGVLPHLSDPSDRTQLIAAASGLALERFFDVSVLV